MKNEDITVEAITGPQDEDVRLSCASHGITDIGCKRLHNEDAFLASTSKGLWAVADGMGGHIAGDLASKTVVESLGDIQITEKLDESVSHAEQAVQSANHSLLQKRIELESNSLIGSTLAMLVARDSKGVVLWAGDSRVYRVRKGSLELLSHDHSVINDLIDKGVLEPAAASMHPDANKITRSVGSNAELELELRHVSILPGDRYIICSDGLTRYVSNAQINMLASPEVNATAKKACKALINAALDAQTSDNVTAIVIEFNEIM